MGQIVQTRLIMHILIHTVHNLYLIEGYDQGLLKNMTAEGVQPANKFLPCSGAGCMYKHVVNRILFVDICAEIKNTMC